MKNENIAKAPARVQRLSDANFAPRFEYGHMAKASVITGTGGDGAKLGSGYVRLRNAEIPWTLKYDEVILVLEGHLTVRTGMGDLQAGPMDCIWLPNGTELIYVAEEALLFYAIEPADWA
ncbi:MAG: ethanolamine utilization protein EutQ [Roseovarius sp.]|nr:ethanolamine utilization protein EutQ [Roseovarius sp.]